MGLMRRPFTGSVDQARLTIHVDRIKPKKTHPYLGLDSGFCKFSVRMTTTAGVIGAAPIGVSATPGIPNRRDQTSPLGGWARSRRGSLRLRLREIYPFRLKCRTVPPPRPRETELSLQK